MNERRRPPERPLDNIITISQLTSRRDAKALAVRYKAATRLLAAGEVDGWDALAAIVWPSPALLEASVVAIRDEAA